MEIFKADNAYSKEDYYVLIDAKVVSRNKWCDFGGVNHQDNYGNPDCLFEIDLTGEQEAIDILSGLGFNVKSYPKDSPDPSVVHLQVKMPFYRQEWLIPTVRTIQNGVAKDISKDTIGSLDNLIIESCNLTIRRHAWEHMSNKGITAQLVDGEFVVRGTKNYIPPYRTDPEPNQNPNDDLPFNV